MHTGHARRSVTTPSSPGDAPWPHAKRTVVMGGTVLSEDAVGLVPATLPAAADIASCRLDLPPSGGNNGKATRVHSTRKGTMALSNQPTDTDAPIDATAAVSAQQLDETSVLPSFAPEDEPAEARADGA